MIHLDTTLLVDVLREQSRAKSGPASRFLEDLDPEEDLWMSVHAVGELYAGAEMSTRPDQERGKIDQLCAAVSIVFPDEEFPKLYGRLLAQLERTRQRVSVMDLLIGAAAIQANAPLVTRNRKDFSRIPGLQIIGY